MIYVFINIHLIRGDITRTSQENNFQFSTPHHQNY